MLVFPLDCELHEDRYHTCYCYFISGPRRVKEKGISWLTWKSKYTYINRVISRATQTPVKIPDSQIFKPHFRNKTSGQIKLHVRVIKGIGFELKSRLSTYKLHEPKASYITSLLLNSITCKASLTVFNSLKYCITLGT